MKIFFTGASSFSGYWFAKALVDAGHQVTATFTQPSIYSYPEAGFSRVRVNMLKDLVRPIWGVRMGDERFFDALESEVWDIVCLHGSFVSNHKALDFPVLQAVESNTYGMQRLVRYLAHEQRWGSIVWTGTYYEANEGRGTKPLRNFSPYALSKQLSWEYLRHFCEAGKVPLAKFVVPNPFGPWEGKGMTSYLARAWLAREKPRLSAPELERDYVPIDLLAQFYCKFLESLVQSSELISRMCPSFYVMKNQEFARLCAERLGSVWDIECELASLDVYPVSSEPIRRFNIDSTQKVLEGWCEKQFWWNLASWYKKKLI